MSESFAMVLFVGGVAFGLLVGLFLGLALWNYLEGPIEKVIPGPITEGDLVRLKSGSRLYVVAEVEDGVPQLVRPQEAGPWGPESLSKPVGVKVQLLDRIKLRR